MRHHPEGHLSPELPTRMTPEDPSGTRYDTPAHDAATLGGPPAPRPPADYPRRFGRFSLLRLVAAGGMGEVYEAEELGHDPAAPGRTVVVRRVALKRILPKLVETPAAVERFERETQAGKRLDHPNVVTVYESGEVGGEHFFTMPYVSGGNLARHVGDEPLTPRQAARVVLQIARAVEHAHGQGTIHRDIKPQNIVLQPAAGSLGDLGLGADDSRLGFTPRLTDFGLARLVTEESSLSLSQKGEAMGTPGYMPPEQALGDTEKISHASDIYSLGAVLYALLAGRPPFPVDGQVPVLAVLGQVVNVEPPRPRKRRPDIPQELEDICLKCLRKTPAERYASAGHLAEALEDFLEGRPAIRHTPRGDGPLMRAWKRLAKSMRKHPLRTGYIAFSAAAIVVFAAVLWGTQSQPRRPDAETEEARLRAAEAALKAEDRRRDRLLDEAERAVVEARASAGLDALRKYQLAVDRYTALIGDSTPGPATLAWRLARASANSHWASLQGQVLPELRPKSIDELKKIEGELEALASFAAEDTGRLTRLADALQARAEAISAPDTLGAHKDALPVFDLALPLRERLCRESGTDTERLQALARCHGYMGDSYLETNDARRCKEAYHKAREYREKVISLLALAGPGHEKRMAEAQCLHARDYWNYGALAERHETLEAAAEHFSHRVKYYRAAFGGSALPGEYRHERADALAWAACMELNHRGGADIPLSTPLGRLNEAIEEIDQWEAAEAARVPPDKLPYNAEATRAFARLLRGKARLMAGDAGGEVDVRAARKFYQLHDGLPDASVHYRLALARALLAKDELKDEAISSLRKAVEKGFNNLPRLRQETGFAGLRKHPGYAAIVAKLEKTAP